VKNDIVMHELKVKSILNNLAKSGKGLSQQVVKGGFGYFHESLPPDAPLLAGGKHVASSVSELDV